MIVNENHSLVGVLKVKLYFHFVLPIFVICHGVVYPSIKVNRPRTLRIGLTFSNEVEVTIEVCLSFSKRKLFCSFLYICLWS